MVFDPAWRGVAAERVTSYFTFKAYHGIFSIVSRDDAVFPERDTLEIPMFPCRELSREVHAALYSYWDSDEKARDMQQQFGYCVNPPKDRFYVYDKQTEDKFAMVGVCPRFDAASASCWLRGRRRSPVPKS